MKKEKTVRTYQRRTKSGKIVTVHEHKASYDAAEEARKASKKAGAGSEFSKKKAEVEESPLGFSEEEYKAWYHWDQDADPENEKALKVEKALRKKMGRKAYEKYFDDLTDNYSKTGHKKAHKSLLDEHTERQKKQDAEISKAAKDIARGAKEKAAEAKASKKAAEKNSKSKGSKILKSSEWSEFENNFEEGWSGEKNVKCLADPKHHREVAAEAARELSKTFGSQDEVWDKYPGKKGTKFIQRYYDAAAKKLYPKEKLWSGDNENNPDFWREHLKDAPASAVKSLWKSEWGEFSPKGKSKSSAKSVKAPKTKNTDKSSSKTTSTPKTPIFPVRATGSAASRAVKALKENGAEQNRVDGATYYTHGKDLYSYSNGTLLKLSGTERAKAKSIITGKSSTKTKKVDTPERAKALSNIEAQRKAHESLKNKGYKVYTYNGEKVYATKSGLVKRVTPRGTIVNMPRPKGGSLTTEQYIKNRIAEDRKKAKTPTSADLRKQADEMDAKSYKETSKATHKKLTAKGYKKHTWQGHTYYHKGKEGSYSGSYITLDKQGNPEPAMSSLKEHFKAQVAHSVGKTYKAKRLK